MSLINCPECNKEISNKANSCPNCGCPILQNEKIVNSVEVSNEQHITTTKTSVAAVWSMVLGVLSFGAYLNPAVSIPANIWDACLSLVVSILAIICGRISKSNIRKSNGTLSGKKIATAGLNLGYINIIIMCVCVFIIGAFSPKLLNNPKVARIAAATADVKSIQLQADSYQLDKGKPISSLQDLVATGYLKEKPVDPWGGDYSVEQRDGCVNIRCFNLEAKTVE